MMHIALLGDSIFDNAPYTAGGPAVIDHLRRLLPAGCSADLLAVDGAVATSVAQQLNGVTGHHTHLVLSVGGNDALLGADMLEMPVSSSAQVLLKLADAADAFERDYVRAVNTCLLCRLPLLVCTIYNGNFPDVEYQRAVKVALTVFNDVIISTAAQRGLRVLDLRAVCNAPEDYANPIEPSVLGGQKIAQAVLRAASEGRFQGAGCQLGA